MDPNYETEVIIVTHSHKIQGKIALVQGARLTDFIRDVGDFMAVTEAQISSLDGKPFLFAKFLNVGTAHIELILPVKLATAGKPQI